MYEQSQNNVKAGANAIRKPHKSEVHVEKIAEGAGIHAVKRPTLLALSERESDGKKNPRVVSPCLPRHKSEPYLCALIVGHKAQTTHPLQSKKQQLEMDKDELASNSHPCCQPF
jgi:hypothetical protein